MPRLLTESSHVNKYVPQDKPFAGCMPRFVIFIMKIGVFLISMYCTPWPGIFRVKRGYRYSSIKTFFKKKNKRGIGAGI